MKEIRVIALMIILPFFLVSCTQPRETRKATPDPRTAINIDLMEIEDGSVTQTPVITNNNSSSIILEPTKTPSQPMLSKSPNPTLTGTPLHTPEQSLGPDTLLLQGLGAGEFVLVDVQNGLRKPLEPDFPIHNFLGWDQGGCTILVSTPSGEIKQINFEGQAGLDLFSINKLIFVQDERVISSTVSLSPTREWITVLTGKGSVIDTYSGRPEFVDVYLIPESKEAEAIMVSQNGGVDNVTWSEDGDLLAYDDYDLLKIDQLFVYNPQTRETTQLTYLNNPEMHIHHIVWSKDRQYISFMLESVTSGERFGIVVDRAENRIVFKWPEVWVLGFLDDAVILQGAFESNPKGIYLVALASGSVEKSYQYDPNDGRGFFLAHPYKEPFLLGYINDDFHSLDLRTGKIETLANIHNLMDGYYLENWFSTPLEFKGESFCNP